MNKKSFSLFLFSTLLLAGCGETSSNDDTITTSQKEVVLPTSIEEVKENISNTKFNGYKFQDKANNLTDAEAKFFKNEVAITGTSTYEEEGTVSSITYKGFAGNTYYDISNASGKHAYKKNIVETVSNKITEITLKDAQEDFNSVSYKLDWFTGDVLNFLTKGKNMEFDAKKLGDNYFVAISGYAEFNTIYSTATATLEFDIDNNLVEGNYTLSDWGKDNFDTLHRTPLDENQKPKSQTKKEAILTLGEVGGEDDKLSYDVSPYFVKTIDDVVVRKSGDSIGDNMCYIGDYLDLDLKAYTPSTALDANSIKILESSDESIIEINSLLSAKAVAAGKCFLTIGTESGSVKVTKEVEVKVPPLTSIWMQSKDVYCGVNLTADISIELNPTGAVGTLKAIIEDETILEFVSFSEDYKTMTVKGLKAGTTTVKVQTTDGSLTSTNSTKVIVDEIGDVSWLTGSWKDVQNPSGSDDTFTTTFTFNSDLTGSVEQSFGHGWPNEAEFTYKYNGTQITFTSWSSDGNYIKKPTSVTISDDKGTVSITAVCEGLDEEFYTLTFNLTKSN